jgi:hypothetical protein
VGGANTVGFHVVVAVVLAVAFVAAPAVVVVAGGGGLRGLVFVDAAVAGAQGPGGLYIVVGDLGDVSHCVLAVVVGGHVVDVDLVAGLLEVAAGGRPGPDAEGHVLLHILHGAAGDAAEGD